MPDDCEAILRGLAMTSRERVEASLSHREPDRTPYFEYVLLSPIADKLLGRPYSADPDYWLTLLGEKGYDGAIRQMAIDRLDLACMLGHDMMYVWPNPLDTDTVGFKFPEAEPLSADPVGTVGQRNEKRSQESSVPQEDTLLIYHVLAEEMSKRDMDLPILAPAVEHGIWTDVNLMMTMLLEPEVAGRHFQLATRRSLAAIEKFKSLGIHQVAIGGDFAGNTPLISAEAYRRFIVPEVRTLSQRIHQLGMWALNGSDGNLWPMIDDFLSGSEVDGYLEIDFQAGMDLGKLKRLYGRKITFYGNLDCGNVLSFASADQVRKHVIDCLKAGSGNGGHVLCTSNAITSSVPLENYLAAINAYREIFSMARFTL